MKKREIEEKYGLYLKMVTTVGNFQNYNRFFNIYTENEDVMRRILLLTPYKELEETEDMGEEVKILEPIEFQGNLWIEEYSFFDKITEREIENIEIEEEKIKEFLKEK